MKRICLAFVLTLLAAGPLTAAVRLGSPFTSHMVLQRETEVPVWGWAEPGEEVTVAFAGQKVSATAGPDGKWLVSLKPMPAASEGREFTVKGSRTSDVMRLQDVVVGEVWIGSGQSNMDFTMSKSVKRFAGVINEEQEIAAADYPSIRMFTAEPVRAYEPQAEVRGEWQVCSPQTAPGFSAVGYFFARRLHHDLKVPIGILTLAYGASTAEAWIGREALAADPELKPMLAGFDAAVAGFRTNRPAEAVAPRSEDVSAPEKQEPKPDAKAKSRKPTVRDPVQDQHNPTVLFNGVIQPVIPYALRGAIWYQGESIVGGAAGRALYPKVQATLIRQWRALWGRGDFPFYIVQLAALEAASNNPWVREAQATALSLPNTGMAVTIDIGERKNVHPRNKQDVGDRLARIALAKVYGRNLEFSGPVYTGMKIEGDSIRLNFSHAEGGLTARDGTLKWFTVAGEDLKFVEADARIEGSTVVVRNPQIKSPVAVRYAWINFPDGGILYNQAGLPAPPFRTDTAKP